MLHRLAAAALLLGCYHLALQFWTSTDCRNGGRTRLPELLARSTALKATRDGVTASAAPAAVAASTLGATAPWRPPAGCNLKANAPAAALLADAPPATTTLHFTFGSAGMLDFLHNWHHFVRKRGLGPVLVGAAEKKMFRACSEEGIAALGIADGLDVWTYRHRANVSTIVQDGKTDWDYYRHSKKSFLELGVVKAAFLWELTSLGYDVLISDLDVVWLADGWERWMTFRYPERPPLPEARLQAMADVLVSTDELDEEFDAHGRHERWPFGVGWGWRSELNTGVLFFRSTAGSR